MLYYTEKQRQRLAEANLTACFDHLEYLVDNPEAIEEIPDGGTIVVPTNDEWVNEQNIEILNQQSRINLLKYLR